MPSKEAISQACCPPAPPKLASLNVLYGIPVGQCKYYHTYMCAEVANPFASVSARIGRHMVSFATFMNLGRSRDRATGAARHVPVDNLVYSEFVRRIFVDVLCKLFERLA